MTRDEEPVAHPEVFTLHWEGPPAAVAPVEVGFPDSDVERARAREAALAAERAERRRADLGQSLWDEIRREAQQRGGDEQLARRKLEAYAWVKLERRGNAGDYAREHDVNHATVRSWLAEVGRLAYEVGYRLHEDRLLLVGDAHPALRAMRNLVNREPGSEAARRAVEALAPEFRGEEPYFHLNEGHLLRARRRLRDSDDTLKEGLAVAEARRIRSLLWNARGQTFWDCEPGSPWPLPDHLERAEKAFRRAAILDQTTYFPFVNLAQLAVDAGDRRRAAYWIGELASARKGMETGMRDDLARYLDQAEWRPAVESHRFWKTGPARWLLEAAKRGVLALAAALLGVALLGEAAEAAPDPQPGIETVAHDGGKSAKGGAGGN